jgi:hypothetical protein
MRPCGGILRLGRGRVAQQRLGGGELSEMAQRDGQIRPSPTRAPAPAPAPAPSTAGIGQAACPEVIKPFQNQRAPAPAAPSFTSIEAGSIPGAASAARRAERHADGHVPDRSWIAARADG